PPESIDDLALSRTPTARFCTRGLLVPGPELVGSKRSGLLCRSLYPGWRTAESDALRRLDRTAQYRHRNFAGLRIGSAPAGLAPGRGLFPGRRRYPTPLRGGHRLR